MLRTINNSFANIDTGATFAYAFREYGKLDNTVLPTQQKKRVCVLWIEGGLFDHLSKIGTLLMPDRSISLFKTLFFLPCVPESRAFFVVL